MSPSHWTIARKFISALVLTVGLLCGPTPEAAVQGEQPQGPLADLPSSPGDHLEKIAVLRDDEWLKLGSPEADPEWGKARGRSWSCNQPVAANLGGMFVFGEGVHAYTKPNGHYMNDLWFYDINAHRWICLYPGIDTRTITGRIRDGDLTVDDDGLLVDETGEPVPPLLIHAYGYLGYDPERKKFLTFGRQFGNYFTTGEDKVFEEANRLFQRQRGGKDNPPLSPFFYDVATGRWECYPVDKTPGGRPYGANVLVYVTSKKQFFYGGTDGAWYLDQENRAWIDAKPQGSGPTGIDHCAAYDPNRDCIYYYQRDGDGHQENFLIYDVKTDEWRRPRADGTGPPAATSHDSIFAFDTVNDRLVVIRVFRHRGDGVDRPRGVYAYDPRTNAWAEPRPLPDEVERGIKNGRYGGYDPVSNAYYCHFASDSRDDGTMWVYRYGRKRCREPLSRENDS